MVTANGSGQVAVGATKIEHVTGISRHRCSPSDLARCDPGDCAHASMIKIALSVGHCGMEVERLAGSDKLFEMRKPLPFNRLQQNFVSHRTFAAAQQPLPA